MRSFLRHPFRVTFRLLWLSVALGYSAATYFGRFGFIRPSRAEQARWLQTVARRVARVLGVRRDISGPLPIDGLLVSNHLGYVDIVVLGSLTPAIFVSKSEVAEWPVFGWFARQGGTLFVRRDKRTEVGSMGAEMAAVLKEDALVVLFPEGTSSGGETVLPFKSALLEPVAGRVHGVTAACIQYSLEDGDVASEVCYWRDMTLGPHLLNLLGKREIRARIAFTTLREASSDRKELARQLHAEVLKLRAVPAC